MRLYRNGNVFFQITIGVERQRTIFAIVSNRIRAIGVALCMRASCMLHSFDIKAVSI